MSYTNTNLGSNTKNIGENNTAIGAGVLSDNGNTGSANNTGLGAWALLNNTSGENNTALGTNSLLNNTSGNNNVGVGVATLLNIDTTSYNTAVGANALENNISGNYNTALGAVAGYNDYFGSSNTYLGVNAGQNKNDLSTYSYSTAIGYSAEFLTNYPSTDQIVIGYTGQNVIVPGNFYVLGESNVGSSGSGSRGPQGSTGYTGPQGSTGYTGPQGTPGTSSGTGAQGPQGSTGYTGPQGIAGSASGTGAQGPQGKTGYTGPQGIAGSASGTGAQGPQGKTGYTGPQGPQGSTSSGGGSTGFLDIFADFGQDIINFNYSNFSNTANITQYNSTTTSYPYFKFISNSASGKYQVVTLGNSNGLLANNGIFTSNNYGITGTKVGLFTSGISCVFNGCSISTSGQYQLVVGDNRNQGSVFLSTDFGSTFSTVSYFSSITQNNSSCVISSSAQYQLITVDSSSTAGAYLSSNFGSNWSIISTSSIPASTVYSTCSMSASGQYQLIGNSTTTLYTSSNYGSTWTSTTLSGNILSSSISSSGQYQLVGTSSNLYLSNNYGSSFTSINSGNYVSVSISGSGEYLGVIQKNTSYYNVYLSSDYGKSFTQNNLSSSVTTTSNQTNTFGLSISNFGQTISVIFGIHDTSDTLNNAANYVYQWNQSTSYSNLGNFVDISNNIPGSTNTVFGSGALVGYLGKTGSYNSAFGYKADVSGNNTTYIHSTAIGAESKITASNQVVLGTSDDTVYIPGNLNVIGTIGTQLKYTILDSIYPVGSIYMNYYSKSTPNDLLGWPTTSGYTSTWVQVKQYTLAGYDASNNYFSTLGGNGGYAQIQSHRHQWLEWVDYNSNAIDTGGDGNNTNKLYDANDRSSPSYIPDDSVIDRNCYTSTLVEDYSDASGNSNYPPYLIVTMWKRTA